MLITGSALGAERQAVLGFGFEMERADATANPVLVGFGDLPPAGDLVANPYDEYACEKNQKGGKNQPGKLHPNHGAAGCRTSDPQRNSMNPQVVSGFLDGKNHCIRRYDMAAWSKAESPEVWSGMA